MGNPFEAIDARLTNIEALLLDLFSTKFNQDPHNNISEKLMTVSEAAELLSLATPTIYALVQRREIPFSKREGSKRLYFSKQELLEWVKSGRKKTNDEIQAEAESELSSVGRRAR
jgi:excisionase family DNA binding protein